jgi:predicted pyridoxine 5'-phosphate oxidase superfamily flavin-nucleotide-binding protein
MKISLGMKKIFQENPVALATINQDNTPNVIAVAAVKIVFPDKAVITDNYMSQTKKNILKNNSVCLASWDCDGNGYKIIGKAQYYDSGHWKNYVKKIPENKNFSAKGAIVVSVSKIINLC